VPAWLVLSAPPDSDCRSSQRKLAMPGALTASVHEKLVATCWPTVYVSHHPARRSSRRVDQQPCNGSSCRALPISARRGHRVSKGARLARVGRAGLVLHSNRHNSRCPARPARQRTRSSWQHSPRHRRSARRPAKRSLPTAGRGPCNGSSMSWSAHHCSSRSRYRRMCPRARDERAWLTLPFESTQLESPGAPAASEHEKLVATLAPRL